MRFQKKKKSESSCLRTTVTVTTKAWNKVLISVKDNGNGIPHQR